VITSDYGFGILRTSRICGPGERTPLSQGIRAVVSIPAGTHQEDSKTGGEGKGGTVCALASESGPGVSFFRSVAGDRLMTSVAQVFDERGEGLIVQGGSASYDKDDRTPHLSKADAQELLANVLATYRREHKTMPARVVMHKTSYFNADEKKGFKLAAEIEKLEVLELVSVRRSGARVLRAWDSPMVRGTAMLFDGKSGIVYLKGTVPYFKVYPGAYIPRALEGRAEACNGFPAVEGVIELRLRCGYAPIDPRFRHHVVPAHDHVRDLKMAIASLGSKRRDTGTRTVGRGAEAWSVVRQLILPAMAIVFEIREQPSDVNE
jgi:hypothetical protein